MISLLCAFMSQLKRSACARFLARVAEKPRAPHAVDSHRFPKPAENGRRNCRSFASEVGESLGEALAAFVVAALGVAMFAGMVAASNSMITTSREALEDIYEASSIATAASTGSAGSVSFTLEELEGVDGAGASLGSASVTIYSSGSGFEPPFYRFELGGGGS